MQDYQFAHAMIRVYDLERAIKFYQQALGLTETRRVDVPEHKFTLVFLSDNTTGFALELTYNYDHEPYVQGTGYGHIAVTVADLLEANRYHKSMGLECSPVRYREDGTPRYYFIEDPDGYEIEILQA